SSTGRVPQPPSVGSLFYVALLEVTVESCVREGDVWRVRWRLLNTSDTALALTSAWVPHGRFRGVDGRVALAVPLAPAGSHLLDLRVRASEAPRTVVETAFLIITTDRGPIFIRMR